MDQTLQYLIEAQTYLNKIQPIDVSNIFFESDSEAVKKQMEKNEKAKGGFLTSIKNAFKSLIESIKNMVNKIRSKIKEMAMSKEDKLAYETFKRICAADPELAKKELTVMDYKKLESDVKPHIEAIKRAINKGDKDAIERENKIIEKLLGDNYFTVKIAASKAWGYINDGTKAMMEFTAWLESDADEVRKYLDKLNNKDAENMSKEEMEALGVQGVGERAVVKHKTNIFSMMRSGLMQCKHDLKGLVRLFSKDKAKHAQGMAATGEMVLRSPIASSIGSKVLKHKAKRESNIIKRMGYAKGSELLKDKEKRNKAADALRMGDEIIPVANAIGTPIINGAKNLYNKFTNKNDDDYED